MPDHICPKCGIPLRVGHTEFEGDVPVEQTFICVRKECANYRTEVQKVRLKPVEND